MLSKFWRVSTPTYCNNCVSLGSLPTKDTLATLWNRRRRLSILVTYFLPMAQLESPHRPIGRSPGRRVGSPTIRDHSRDLCVLNTSPQSHTPRMPLSDRQASVLSTSIYNNSKPPTPKEPPEPRASLANPSHFRSTITREPDKRYDRLSILTQYRNVTVDHNEQTPGLQAFLQIL
jgi:hypothetical protein